MLRSWTALIVAVGVALLSALTAAPARAQGLMTPVITERSHQAIDQRPEWINREDCLENADILFTVPRSGTFPLSANLHVWASTGGASCQNAAERNDSGCKQVYQGDVFETSGTQQVSARILARNIVRDGFGALTTVEPPETICDLAIEDKTDANLQFFVLDSGGNVIGTVATFQMSYDLVGPSPPTAVKAGVGEDALVVSWNPSSSDEILGQYAVYVDEAGGTPPGGEGGQGGQGSTPSDGCTSDVLVPGEIPTGTPNAETNASTTEAEASGLTNGVLYAIGVAAMDAFENPGPLSKLDCATPEPVTGFFEAYRDAGGLGGGGYCALGATRSHVFASGCLLAALGLVARRRRPRATTRRTP
jgi:hypothetical protein